MVSPETKSLHRDPKEVIQDHPLFLRGASSEEIREIIGLNPQIAKTDQQKLILFAQRLLGAEMIGKDLTYWDKLQKLYETNKRELPKDFVTRLRLEAFLIARTGVLEDNYVLLDRFCAIGKSIDSVWFSKSNNITYKDEQSFIRDEINNRKSNRNGNNAVVEATQSLEDERLNIYREELAKLGTGGSVD